MPTQDNDFSQIDVPLSEAETFHVGQIIALWGMLEHIIFMQALESFDTGDRTDIKLPKTMNNTKFSDVLAHWKARVAEVAPDDRREVLLRQHERIEALQEPRNALAHGMWDWSLDDLSRISTVRVKKQEVITMHFDAAALEDMSSQLGGIIYKIKYPGGAEDYAGDMVRHGFRLSRQGAAMMAGNPIAEQLLPHMLSLRAIPDKL